MFPPGKEARDRPADHCVRFRRALPAVPEMLLNPCWVFAFVFSPPADLLHKDHRDLFFKGFSVAFRTSPGGECAPRAGDRAQAEGAGRGAQEGPRAVSPGSCGEGPGLLLSLPRRRQLPGARLSFSTYGVRLWKPPLPPPWCFLRQ